MATRKPTVPGEAAAKPAAASRKPAVAAKKPAMMRAAKAPKVVAAQKDTAAPDSVTVVKLKEIIDRVVAAANLKKKDVKPVVEATLKAIGDALAAGEALILPPLGRLRVSRSKDMANGAMLTLRLKRGSGGKPGPKADDDLAEDGE